MPGSVISLADRYACEGADGLYLYNFTGDEKSREEFLATVRQIEKKIDIPFYVGIYVARFEDAKKALYTGASMVVMRKALLPVDKELQEITDRFSKDKLALEVDMRADFMTAEQLDEYYELGIGTAVLKHIDTTPSFSDTIAQTKMRVMVRDGLIRNDLAEILSYDTVSAVLTNYFEDKDIYKAKKALKKKNVDVEVFESLIDFSDFKLLDNGLIPVVVQDYRTNEVLMVAYMNEDSYKMTIDTGKMTYYSRSRKKLWLKGETSGHFQYVKSLMIDCDNDTILAKVRQIGAACHTGNRSCFFKELAKKDYVSTNPLTVLMDDYDIIMSRKNNPKEGSYTNYLFDKGIDKILKKCGEEAVEIIIAAKNPDAEELKYEIADFLYHMMVLMAECGLDWNDITKELVNRR
ncbi:bifunctional phosphoribosyl-AMP cyclohydrolase/phosphoribosyl-ATP diphosphatase HisIE [Lachnospiraceae bacterium BX3]|uniref:Histidine biosynthesis bifunctional protein HisIE n=2 Tax=Jutongia hominis TaxID=2763664 RepID=A0ABR7MU48_9FIRM|nr:bifunctional phosphoribosyl-AMP cyclohydrolase/phosphoribosyl-ATP diphosphatase HisIE [Jutongia hominis]